MVDSKTISSAMRELAVSIQCDDGAANAVCSEAAERIDLLQSEIDSLKSGEFICTKCGLRKNSENDNEFHF